MKTDKKGRITNSSLSDMTASFFEQGSRKGHFNTIAHPPLGFGTKGCNDTEVECYETISFFTKVAREEESRVFILGFAPQSVPSLWIKTAELIIQGSKVNTVLIPFARKINGEDSSNPIVDGRLLYIDENGIFHVELMGKVSVLQFWTRVSEMAILLNRT